MSGTVSVQTDHHIVVVTLSRPDKLNALNTSMYDQLITIMTGLAQDDDVRVVIVTGAGANFCAGSDIAQLDQLHHTDWPVRAETALTDFAKPVIAAIAGNCLGGGLQLAAACDVRLAADTARFAVPPAKLGIVYPLSATRRLMSLIGPSATKYLIYSGDAVNATRALHMGLVDELVPPDLLHDRARHLAETIARRSQLTLQATKQIVDDIVNDRLDEATVAAWVDEAAHGPDLPEGMSAFAARRTPQFTWTHPRRR